MPTRRFSGTATAASDPDNGGDHSGGGGGGTYVDDVFSTYVYEGTGAEQDIVNGIDLAGEGGMVWIKCRSCVVSHQLFDTERVNELNGYVYALSSDTNATQIETPNIRSFNSDGFRLGYDNEVSGNGQTFASWTFRKAPNFFDVVTYTGDGQPSITLPHNLGITPGMIIVKRLDSSADWNVFFPQVLGTSRMKLNTTDAAAGTGWADPMADDSTVTFETNLAEINAANGEYVLYLFAHDDSDESMIKCGSFSHVKGTQDTIDLGWEPQFLLIKSSNSTGDWLMVDTMRGWTSSTDNPTLCANKAKAEENQSMGEPTSTGFLWPADSNTQDFIYMAIRRPDNP